MRTRSMPKPAPAWLAIACAIALALGLTRAHADAPPASRSAVLTAIEAWPGPDGTRLVFPVSADVAYRMAYDESSKTATLVLVGTVPAPDLSALRQLDDGAVRRLRVTETPSGVEIAIEMVSFTRVTPAGEQGEAGFGTRFILDVPRPGVSERQAAQDQAYRDLRARTERIVVVDPGHGGDQVGAIGPRRTIEKDVCLQIARKLQDRLNREPGVRVVLTRDGDYNVALRDRYKVAERLRADVFISIHANSSRRPSGRGTEVYFLSLESASDEQSKLLADAENAADLVGATKADESDLVSILFDLKQNEVIRQSSSLAEDVLDQIVEQSRVTNRGVKQAPFAVLKSPVVPSILVETAFINHPADAKLLRDSSFQSGMADQIARGVLKYLATAPRVPRDASGASAPTSRRSGS